MALAIDATDDHAWRKSTFSVDTANCVEVAVVDGYFRAVRDTKLDDGPILVFTATEWAAFVAGVKAGEFDV